MKPYFKLTKQGGAIFKKIVSRYQVLSKDKDEMDVYGLTVLAKAFDDFGYASEKLDTYRDNDEVKGFREMLTLMDKAIVWIAKLGPKFGIGPADRERIKSFTSEPPVDTRTKEGRMKKLLK